MREIKFRAWDNVKKEWLLAYNYGTLGGFSLVGEMVMLGEWSSELNRMLRGDFGECGEELKIMQYTGLKDKNGVEIYEGDIIVGHNHKGERGMGRAIEFTSNGWIAQPNMMLWALNEPEVIGNIYENKELLK